MDQRDDAGVYLLNEQQAIIQTLDFFTPMVDDPYRFGQIAAVNALNDVYAMGGSPLLAMNLVMFPKCGDFTVLQQILAGGLSKIEEAGALLVGGHTVDDNEPKYGLSVTGIVHPEALITNAGAKPGDAIFLTKPLGSGIIATAIKAQMVDPAHEEEAVRWMTTLGKDACAAMQAVGVNAATDVTGFGLIGHLQEMAAASNVAMEIISSDIPFMSGVLEAANRGLIPAGAYTNRDYLQDKVQVIEEMDPIVYDLLFSPETAGGFIISVPDERKEQLLQAMQASSCSCFLIGSVLREGFQPIRVRGTGGSTLGEKNI